MNRQASNVVRMGLKRSNFLHCIIVENAQLEVIRSSHKPVLSCNELDTAHRHFRDFKRLHNGTRLMVIYVDRAIIKTGEQPWFCWMKVDTLDTIGPRE